MNRVHFSKGQILFNEGDVADRVFRLVSGEVDVIRELDGNPIVLGQVRVGQFVGEMAVIENRPRSATVMAASEVELEALTPTEFLRQIAGSPETAFGLLRRLSQRLREADDRIVNDERPSEPTRTNSGHESHEETGVSLAQRAHLSAKSGWLQRQLPAPIEVGERPFVVGRIPSSGERSAPSQTDLLLDDAMPFRLSRNHFVIEKRGGVYHVRDLRSTLGTIVNSQPIGNQFHIDDSLLRAGENEVIAGGTGSPFVFSVTVS